MAAKHQPPHLKAIFPLDPRGAYGEAGGFRDEYPGGVIHLFRFLLQVYASAHQQKGSTASACRPKKRSFGRRRCRIRTAGISARLRRPRSRASLPGLFDILVDPYDKEETRPQERGRVLQNQHSDLHRLGLVWLHLPDPLNGAQNWFRNIKAPHKKLLLAGPAHLDRPCQGVPRRDAELV